MQIYVLAILVYLSFMLDFLVWPIPSEASTFSLIHDNEQISYNKKILLILVFVSSLLFYLTPLGLSVYGIITGTMLTTISKGILGISISIFGRIISIAASIRLSQNESGIVCDSLFRYSRNPIILGLHLTITGMLIICGKWYLWLFFFMYLMNIHYKIKIEESRLYEKFGAAYRKYRADTPRYLIIL
jgi:protein-S-isoprenylcysteine O-methyltransferase Ste14